VSPDAQKSSAGTSLHLLGPIYIAGPTASGKTAVALRLAEQVGGEIISVDSMQVYRGLDIGTAKPSAEERARIQHHLIDIAEIDEPFDVARFLTLAREAESDIRRRERVPIFCGGTGLYFKALVAGVGQGPPSDPALREEIEKTALPILLHELQARDQETFERIDRANPRRVIRAVEVIRLTGEKYSVQRSDWKATSQTGRWFGLERDRRELITRINTRVDDMLRRGLLEETRALLKDGLEKNPTAMQSLGYRQVSEHLRGERDLAEAIALIKQKTAQFAKRQMTWFRRQLELEWIPLSNQENEQNVADQIARKLDAAL
jgi:tRNA dimethylallyltransferase